MVKKQFVSINGVNSVLIAKSGIPLQGQRWGPQFVVYILEYQIDLRFLLDADDTAILFCESNITQKISLFCFVIHY